jgi:hypothetical protein
MVFSMETKTIVEVPVVREYPGMPADRDIELSLTLSLETSPIAMRPYRMTTPKSIK